MRPRSVMAGSRRRGAIDLLSLPAFPPGSDGCGLDLRFCAGPQWRTTGTATGEISADLGVDGKVYISDQATIWRWRTAFQHDFAARMDWTIKPFAEANHSPLVTVNGREGTAPIMIEARVGQPITLDAGSSRDPDGHQLTYRWFHYEEAGFVPGANMAAVEISQGNTAKATVKATTACRKLWRQIDRPCPSGIAHLVLAVTDNGSPALTSYRRIILNVGPERHTQ